MKYGLKLRSANTFIWYNWMSESMGEASKPYLFDSYELAEIYAQNHEMNNFIIEPYENK